MKKTTLFIILSLCTTLGFAHKKDTLKFGIYATFPEYNKADISKFNDLLASYKIPTESLLPISFQLCATFNYNIFSASITLAGTKVGEGSVGSYELEQSYGHYSSLEVGCNLLHSRKVNFYPFIGLKEAEFNYEYYLSSLGKQTPFSEYLTTTTGYKNIDYSRTNFITGLGIEYGRKFFIGLKTGIYIPLGDGTWYFSQYITVNNSTMVKINYKYFIDFYIGFHGLSIRK